MPKNEAILKAVKFPDSCLSSKKQPPGHLEENHLPAMENSVHAYAATTDGCRRLVRGTNDNARQGRRIKPDPETHALAELDQGSDVVKVGHNS